MVRPRGETGKVRGIPMEVATLCLIAAVQFFRANQSGEFTRVQAGEFFRRRSGEWGEPERVVDGLVWALVQLPGNRKVARGKYRLHENAETYAQHRMWRIALPRLDPESALQLARLISGAPNVAGRLKYIQRKAERALRGIGVR